MKNYKANQAVGCIALIGILVNLAIIGGVIAVVIHFVHKLW
jgi:hypothetical protein